MTLFDSARRRDDSRADDLAPGGALRGMIVEDEWRSGGGDCRGGEVAIAKRIAMKISLGANEGNKIVGVIISGRSVNSEI